ncbi:MAG: DoxX family membrane protein [Gammaproteobacteria bacterium]|nr:DoxX family membrane protein [Gammaproteobacteria bacterium]
MNSRQLAVALLILRIALAAFLLLFGIDKLVATETTISVFAHYYGLSIAAPVAYAAGVLEILLGLAMLAGLWKTVTYGLGLLLHAISTLATYEQLLFPFGENHLFIASIPVLAAFIALFLLRRQDKLLSLDASVREEAK